MVYAQHRTARKSGSSRFLGIDVDTVVTLREERHRIRQEALRVKRMGIHVHHVSTAGHSPEEWPITATLTESIQPAPTLPLPMPAELKDAIDELDDVTAYAEEIEVETPSAAAFDNAGRLLEKMYRISPRGFSVYPATGGHIVIDARGANDNIVVVSCGSDGSVLCLATIDGEDRRSWYETARTLPDGFISEALAAL